MQNEKWAVGKTAALGGVKMKIKPCYRDYKWEIGVLFIGFRREDKTPEEAEIWQKRFPNIKVGESVGMVVPRSFLHKAKKDCPYLDFDTEEVI